MCIRDRYKSNKKVKSLFKEADDVLGFALSNVMFEGSEEELKQTKITQPAIFLHSIAELIVLEESHSPNAVAGHSLGEISALTAAGVLDFEDGLKLVSKRALAMQAACETEPSTMAAILGLENEVVEGICEKVEGIVVAANYNCPGQLVISGAVDAIDNACELLKEAGARRALVLPVGGAFHSPLMEPARAELAKAIEATTFNTPICPVYQNVTAAAITDPNEIKKNLVAQLTAPVRWTQTMHQMIADGVSGFTEVGPGKVLQGLVKKVDRQMPTESAEL